MTTTPPRGGPDTHGPSLAHDLATALTGTLLVATTYGLARFGVGLFGPRILADDPGSDAVLGTATAAQFLSYCCSALAAGAWSDRRPRLVVLLAGSTAVAGCVTIAFAPTAAMFVGGAFVAGLGAGFASPALVRLVDAGVTPWRRDLVQGTVNTGTAVGVVVAGLLSFAFTTVTSAWLTMAALSALVTAAVLRTSRRTDARRTSTSPGVPFRDVPVAALRRPAAAALLAGVGSAMVWSHAPALLAETDVVPAGLSGWLWIVLGLGGLGGVLTAAVARRLGSRGAWALHTTLAASSTALLGLAMSLDLPVLALVGVAVFGFAYMCLSGTLILAALERVPEAAGAATSALFVALAVGQSAGSLLIGRLATAAGPVEACLLATASCLLAAAVRWQRPATRD